MAGLQPLIIFLSLWETIGLNPYRLSYPKGSEALMPNNLVLSPRQTLLISVGSFSGADKTTQAVELMAWRMHCGWQEQMAEM